MTFLKALKYIRDYAETKWKNPRATGLQRAELFLQLDVVAQRVLREEVKGNECRNP